ncbi:MAG: carbamate kinase [Dehalococcoidia bacterium]|jgi:carbamate kinase
MSVRVPGDLMYGSKTRPKTYVIALGGNAILRAGQMGTIEEQFTNLRQTGKQLVGLLGGHNHIVITHGNGPQVGNLLLAVESAKDIPPLPLDTCSAATQGFMGYMIQQALSNCLREMGLTHNITTVITQVIVNEHDPAFKRPSKPIGPFYSSGQAGRLKESRGWQMVNDSDRGYRRVVPSPEPLEIQQARIIKSMLDAGEIVIAVGGGGIPVIRRPDNSLHGVEAVIDKDMASARLAMDIGADVLLILTAVKTVFTDFGKPSQKPLYSLTDGEAEALLKEGQFGAGSMEPKIVASLKFLRATPAGRHREVVITAPEKALDALAGITGTKIALGKSPATR